MALDHWGIDRSPFETSLQIDQFYPSSTHDEALARIEYLINAQRQLGLLLGGPGMGKSLVLQVAAQQLARNGCAVVFVDALGLSTRELLWQVVAGLGAAPPQDADVAQLWRRVSDRVAENRMQQIHTLLLVDDAGQAGPDLLAHLVRLARIDRQASARWTIVLASEPEQATRWKANLLELVDLRINLPPWNESDTIGYVQTALIEAGRFDPVFEEEALQSLHKLSGGVPRQIARLADFALLAGAAAEMETIDAPTIESAQKELSWNMPLAASY